MKWIVYTFWLVPVLYACSDDSDKGELLAQVGEQKLYQADLRFLFTKTRFSYDDSVALVKNYTTSWAEEQILVQEAQRNKNIDLEVIDKRVENFRNDLLIHELENSIVAERLDTQVTDREIQEYYLENQKEFQLNDYLVKVLYLKIPFDAPDIEKVGQSYKLERQGDLEAIQTYAKTYATNFYYDVENWIYFDDLLKEVPLQDINKDKFILKRSKIRFEEGGFYYFLNVIEYKLKNTTSPLSFERENIRDRIINMRIKKLREDYKNEVISKAYAENVVKIY